MTEPRHDENSSFRPPWPSAAAPHGYDRSEFDPEQSGRDFPEAAQRRKHRMPDEERRYLKGAEAAMGGPEVRPDVAVSRHAGAWDREEEISDGNAPSRLYRD